MKRRTSKPFLFLFVALFLVMSIPRGGTEKVRGILFATMTPVWETAQSVVGAPSEIELEVQRLQAEIQLLHNQTESWHELYLNEKALNLQMASASDDSITAIANPDSFLKLQLEAIPAKVIFRSPGSWNSALWINVGSNENTILGKTVVAKNSPVVVGNSVVGVIDYVGKSQSRVRLITDSGVAPSVRAARGGAANRRLIEMMSAIQNEVDDPSLAELLDEAKERLDTEESWYLAKGELRGSSEPLWRSRSSLLRGVGFNYDFADSYGPARDLRTGEPQGAEGEAVPIIEENDLLVTTGMDGVFPPGLRVARVTHIEMLKEGDYYYELEALPTAGNLSELKLVFILPPVGFDPEDQAPYRVSSR